ncbi:AtpZ/AtpI family protein [Tamlana sp. 2_MG-2023]|uniref:AtpZ/AtpI family protein n=1 Tax=unclassified Tamlana TaxID=2614803 RepID=UPI0026E24FB1|nr:MULTISPECIES: AtpZ/AtpI family protein [unclassified Tamlana]MDO6759774.1 AtpZ/AtpI family protein [Tamlana sp. 2_MG-2023]MDO6791397.1 AtpZ/AtpI family protein [Tamlana sp. 1_MG-2023]
MDNKKGKPKNQLNKYVRFTTIALQMGLTVYLGSLLGAWVDSKTGNTNQLYYKIITLLAVFLAMFSVIRQVLNITNNDKND